MSLYSFQCSTFLSTFCSIRRYFCYGFLTKKTLTTQKSEGSNARGRNASVCSSHLIFLSSTISPSFFFQRMPLAFPYPASSIRSRLFALRDDTAAQKALKEVFQIYCRVNILFWSFHALLIAPFLGAVMSVYFMFYATVLYMTGPEISVFYVGATHSNYRLPSRSINSVRLSSVESCQQSSSLPSTARSSISWPG